MISAKPVSYFTDPRGSIPSQRRSPLPCAYLSADRLAERVRESHNGSFDLAPSSSHWGS